MSGMRLRQAPCIEADTVDPQAISTSRGDWEAHSRAWVRGCPVTPSWISDLQDANQVRVSAEYSPLRTAPKSETAWKTRPGRKKSCAAQRFFAPESDAGWPRINRGTRSGRVHAAASSPSRKERATRPRPACGKDSFGTVVKGHADAAPVRLSAAAKDSTPTPACLSEPSQPIGATLRGFGKPPPGRIEIFKRPVESFSRCRAA